MSKNIYYSYDIDTGDLVAKTRFNDDGSIDRWEGINEPDYTHDKFSSSARFARGGNGDIFSRHGSNGGKTWDDRDGVM